jgi:hypothetical protein
MRRAALLLVGAALTLTTPRPASAQASSDPAAAAELFRQGRAALDAKDYALACEKLLESVRLDLRVGTLISLGVCEEATGKLASSRLRWQQAAQLARRVGDERAAYCEEHFAAIDARVPRLTIRVAPGAPRWTFVRKDSVDVGPASIGVPLPIEPGPHVVVALAPHHDTRSYAVEGVDGQSSEIVVEPGGLLPELPPSPDDIPPPSGAPSTSPAPRPQQGLRIAALGAGVLGLAGIGAGTYFGLKAIADANDALPHCTGDVCDHTGAVTRRDAIAAGNLATAMFVAGGVMLGGGTVMFVLSLRGAPDAVRVTPAATAGGAGVRVTGSW